MIFRVNDTEEEGEEGDKITFLTCGDGVVQTSCCVLEPVFWVVLGDPCGEGQLGQVVQVTSNIGPWFLIVVLETVKVLELVERSALGVADVRAGSPDDLVERTHGAGPALIQKGVRRQELACRTATGRRRSCRCDDQHVEKDDGGKRRHFGHKSSLDQHDAKAPSGKTCRDCTPADKVSCACCNEFGSLHELVWYEGPKSCNSQSTTMIMLRKTTR